MTRNREPETASVAVRRVGEFDVHAMYAVMDARREAFGLSWAALARAVWDQSAVLNSARRDHPISPATLAGIAKRGDCTCQHALFVLRWLRRSPEEFLVPFADRRGVPLPPAGEDQRLRWNLGAVFESLNEHRRKSGLAWSEVAQELRCTEHQLTGIRTARFAIGMKLMMRVVQWVGQPSATFIYPAPW